MNSLQSRQFALESTAKALCDKHGGKWLGAKGMACCPAHDDRTPSLSITLGKKAILFHCFAGCSNQAVLAALGRNGTPISTLFGVDPSREDHKNTKPSRSNRAALAIWHAAKLLQNSPAKAYLEARGIKASSTQLRFHPLTPKGCGEDVIYQPAMIAAVSMDEGPVAIHRTFLTLSDGIVERASQAKMALGPLGQGAVRLFAPKDGELGLAEGVETAMAARALTGIPVWAVLSAGRLGRVAIPDSVTKLHLFIDFDDVGANAAKKAIAALQRAGRTILVRRPPTAGQDWNDTLITWLASKGE